MYYTILKTVQSQPVAAGFHGTPRIPGRYLGADGSGEGTAAVPAATGGAPVRERYSER